MTSITSTRVVRRRPPVFAARRFVTTRKAVQTLSVALLIGMPIVGIFRVDVEGNYVLLLWQRLPIAWAALIVPALIIVPLGGFLAFALRYGRLFCSWACPQGALNEASTKSSLALWGRRKPWLTRRDRAYPQSARRRSQRWLTGGRAHSWAIALYLARGILLPPLAAFGVVSYVVAPGRLGAMLLSFNLSQAAVLAFVALCGMFYADFFLLQETACRVCFYGYLQSVASYAQGTGVRRNPDLKSLCHGCSGCRDACFAGVDPRVRAWERAGGTQLVFDQCVSCGDCVVACDDLTSRRGVPLIMELPPRVLSHAEQTAAAVRPGGRS